METKKSLKADLEKGKSLSLLLGLVVAVAILFVSFEWGTRDVTLLGESGITFVPDEEDLLPITLPETTPPPPPPPEPVVIDEINIVDDHIDTPDVPIFTIEDNKDRPQQDIYISPTTVEEEEIDKTEFFIIVEEMPEFPGGDKEMLLFINKSIKYPVIAQENGIQGRVICTFIIDATGKVTNAEVFRGVDPSLDKEALRVVNSMPDWKPRKQRGKPVRVKYTIPITFRLQ